MTQHPNHPNRTLLRTGLTAFLLFLFLIGLPSITLACSCGSWNSLPFRGLEEYNIIFLGTVIESGEEEYEEPEVSERRKRDPEIPPMKKKRNKGIISVEKIWKGSPVKKVTYFSMPPCGWSLEQGEKYLIYASQKNGSISLPVCSPLSRVRYAEWEMMILDWTFAGLSKEEIIDRLAKILLEHKEERSRLQAVSLLRDVLMKGDSQKDVEEILQALLPPGRRDEKIIEALMAEDRRGVRFEKVLSAFMKAMKDPSPQVRAHVLGNIPLVWVRRDALVEFLFQSAKDPSLNVRLVSFRYLVGRGDELGGKRLELVRIMENDLKAEEKKLVGGDSEENKKLIGAVLIIIRGLIQLKGEVDNEKFMPFVLEGLRQKDYAIRESALSSLCVLKGPCTENLPELKTFLKENLDEDAQKRVNKNVDMHEMIQKIESTTTAE